MSIARALIKCWQFFDYISAPKQIFKNQVINFFGINMRSAYAKFQPSSFKTEGGDKG